jgi:hypothetical protein
LKKQYKTQKHGQEPNVLSINHKDWNINNKEQRLESDTYIIKTPIHFYEI